VAYWRTLHSDPARTSMPWSSSTPADRPQVTWGTSPEMVLGIDARVPDPDKEKDPSSAAPSSAR
jgi:3-isopropylmalate/(R)-2-methylmalate dehydratase large subunit